MWPFIKPQPSSSLFGKTIQRRAIDLDRRGVPRKRGRRNYFPAGFAGSSRPLRFK